MSAYNISTKKSCENSMARLVVTVLGLVASTSAAGGLLGSVRELYLEQTKVCVCVLKYRSDTRFSEKVGFQDFTTLQSPPTLRNYLFLAKG